MKISTESYPIKQVKEDAKPTGKDNKVHNLPSGQDRVSLSNDTFNLIIQENQSASSSEIVDVHQAEKAVSYVKHALLNDPQTASEIHQLDDKRVLFLAVQ